MKTAQSCFPIFCLTVKHYLIRKLESLVSNVAHGTYLIEKYSSSFMHDLSINYDLLYITNWPKQITDLFSIRP